MSATRSWLEFRSDNLLPVVALNVKDMNVVHPMDPIVSSKVDDLGVYQAACCGNTSAWLISAHNWLHPCESFCVKIKDIVQLSQLVRLSTKDIDFFIKCYG